MVSGPPTPGRDNAAGAPKVLPAPLPTHPTIRATAPPAISKAKAVHSNKRTATSRSGKAPLVDAFVQGNTVATETGMTEIVPEAKGAVSTSTILWFLGAGALTVLAAGASVFVRKKASTEWDIEEMSDDV